MKITGSTSIKRCGDQLHIKTANKHLRREIAEAVAQIQGRCSGVAIPITIHSEPTRRGLKTIEKFGPESFRAEHVTTITYHGDNPNEMGDIINVCYKLIMDTVDYSRIKDGHVLC